MQHCQEHIALALHRQGSLFTSRWRLICRAYHKRSLSVALLAVQAESGALISRPVTLIPLAPVHATPRVPSGAPSVAICTATCMGAG